MIDERKLIDFLIGEKYILIDENSTDIEYKKKHEWELSRNIFITSIVKEIEKLKLPREVVPDEYITAYYDGGHSGNCFDEDVFYKQEELIYAIKHSKESIDKDYIDKTKVFAKVGNMLVELCEVKGK